MEWRRLSKLKNYNFLFNDEENPITPLEIIQGDISNCYIISPISALSAHPNIIKKIFNSKIKSEKGQYSLNLCQQGIFKEVILDDFIPISKKKQEPGFCKSRENKTFWPVLLEKAFAKKFGAYWNTGGGGNASKIFKDLTGAPVYNYNIEKYVLKYSENKEKLYKKIFTLIENSIKQGYAIVAQTNKEKAKVMTQLGLSEWHYYVILGTLKLENGDSLVKVRNPWGGEKVWEGQYSRNDDFWLQNPKGKIENFEGNSGCFYIPIDCFVSNFQEIDICEVSETAIYAQYPFNSFNIVKEKTNIFQIKVKKTGVFHISFSQMDSKSNTYDYTSLILLENDSKLKFFKATGNLYRDLTIKTKLEASKNYILYVKKNIN